MDRFTSFKDLKPEEKPYPSPQQYWSTPVPGPLGCRLACINQSLLSFRNTAVE